MKIGNKTYNSVFNSKRIERNWSLHRDKDTGGSVSMRNKSFADLQEKLQEHEAETGFRSMLDPRIAIALTVANSNKVFSLKSDKEDSAEADVDIVHDQSENRGKTTNIEV
jgi:hypothetical protein